MIKALFYCLLLIPMVGLSQVTDGELINQTTNCYDRSVKIDFDQLCVQYLKNGFTIMDSSFNTYTSAKEYVYPLKLTTDNDYIFFMITERFIDQSSIVLLNSANTVVGSAFKETGIERHRIALSYKPNFPGEYFIRLKVIDYAGRDICNRWAVMQRPRKAPK